MVVKISNKKVNVPSYIRTYGVFEKWYIRKSKQLKKKEN